MGGLYVIDYAIFNSTLLLSVFTVVDAYHNLSEIYILKAIRDSYDLLSYLSTQYFGKKCTKKHKVMWSSTAVNNELPLSIIKKNINYFQ